MVISTSEGEVTASPATRLFHSSKMPCVVVAIMGARVNIDVNAAKEMATQTLPNIPRFSSVLVKDEKHGTMRWRPTTVNVDNHIICPEIDTDKITSGDQLVDEYLETLTSKPMDNSKPLWELHILNVKTTYATATGIWRIHHSMGDGISLISILLALTRKTSDPESLPTIPPKKTKVPKSSLVSRFLYALWLLVMLTVNTVADVAAFVATIMFLKDTVSPITADEGVQLRPKRVLHRSLSLDDFKLVKTAANATINDVILGVTQAALSRYLNRKYANDASDKKQKRRGSKENDNSLPKNMRMRASLIFNIRPSKGVQVYADMMKRKSKAKWGNRIGYALIPLKIALREDPLKYVREAQATANRKKLSLESRFSYRGAYLVFKLLGIKVAALLTRRVVLNTTLCLSNVVGPQEEISICGHPISYIAPSVHGTPTALLIHFQSYINKMTVVITYDPSVIPDPHQLLIDMEESLGDMKAAVLRNKIENGDQPLDHVL